MAYTKEQIETKFNYILSEIEKGRSLRSVLSDENTPDQNTFYRWIDKSEEKREQYARATTRRAEAIFEDILSIADNQEDDVIISEDGVVMTNHNVIQRARLRVDARKWMLSKMNPKKYGDKLETENTHSGEIKITREIIK